MKRVILVTGGNRGIGLAIVEGLTQNSGDTALQGCRNLGQGGAGATRAPSKGAETAIWLANLPADAPSGKFFRDKQQINW